MGCRKLGVDLEHPLITGDGFIEELALDGCLGQERQEDQGPWLELDRPPEPGQGLVPLTFLLPCSPEIDAGLGHLWAEPDRLAVGPSGLLKQAESAQSVSQVVVGFGQAGLQGGGPPAVRQSLLCLAQVEQELAQVGQGRSKIGVDRQGAAKVVECLVF